MSKLPAGSLGAYDYYLRGLAGAYHLTRESTSNALRFFKEAIALDPEFASAYSLAAMCYLLADGYGWITDPRREFAEASRLARRAAELGNDDGGVLCLAGFLLVQVVSDFDNGAVLIDRGSELNPNLSRSWQCSGWAVDLLCKHKGCHSNGSGY